MVDKKRLKQEYFYLGLALLAVFSLPLLLNNSGLTAAVIGVPNQNQTTYTQNSTLDSYLALPSNISENYTSSLEESVNITLNESLDNFTNLSENQIPYTEKSNLSNNLTVNLINEGLTIQSTNCSVWPCSCGSVLNSSITMTSDLNCNETGLTFGASNIILDCDGHFINYSIAGVFGYGVNTSGDINNLTLRNCRIYEGNESGLFKDGIYFISADDSLIENNTITLISDSASGIVANTISTTITLRKNGINTSGVVESSGIRLELVNGATLDNNIFNISGNLGMGIYLSVGSFANMTNNQIYTWGGNGYGINLNEVSDSFFH